RRIVVADTYASARAGLVAAVASANRCRAVYAPDARVVTVIGYEHDLDAVEWLTASLLTQATGAMVRQGPRRDHTGRSRTRSFRRAFLLGFGQRIGERLRRATEEQVSTTSHDDDRLLPVLAAREDRLEAAVRRAFPDLARRRREVVDRSGWVAGQSAADAADLGAVGARLPPG
ncbi:MAG: hypothetical protein WD041_00720, partial [Nitriliruptoraceae bacterium]